MAILIKNWKELSKLKNNKYHIAFDSECYNGWIVPITDEPINNRGDFKCNCTGEMQEDFFKHHVYLSTHTFYGSQYQYSTKVLQEHGFDVEINNWDKEVK